MTAIGGVYIKEDVRGWLIPVPLVLNKADE